MKPKVGQLVQVRMMNGAFFDGIVEYWSNKKSVLVLPDTKDTVIIQKTLSDVMLVKIFNTKPVEENKTDNINQEFNAFKDKLTEQFNSLAGEVRNESNISKMAELKDGLNMLEREEISSRFKSNAVDNVRNVNYGIPGNIQVDSSSQRTVEKTSQGSDGFSQQLQGLFSEKH